MLSIVEDKHVRVKSMNNDICNNQWQLSCFIRQIAFFIIIMGLLSFFGCAVDSVPIYIRNGKEYGRINEAFRNRWWNYYERGLSFAEGEFYTEAVTDLKLAIDHRAKDQRMARTYGMHFTDYFPHRELGVIYYHIRELETAKKELELSLGHFPSAKARFYLDRVRKAMIGHQGKTVSPPSLTLDFKTDEVWTRADQVIISGVASDQNYVSEITIMGKSLFSEGSQKEIAFRKILLLSQGRHEIEVTARNLPGKMTTQKVILHADREGPTITIEALHPDQEGSQAEVTISGSAYDGAGISELSINGQPVMVQEEAEVFFTKKILTDKSELELNARDRLGNQTLARIPLAPPRASKTAAPIMLASVTSDMDGSLLASLFGPKDTLPPNIKLKGWTDTQTVFLEKIYIEGKISDESKIVRLAVNQTPVLRREGRYVFFGHLAELEEGKNNILIRATDEAGNMAEKKISVIRKIPKALQLEERLSLTVLPFEQSGDVSDFSVSFQDTLIHALVGQNRFRVIERDKLDVILQEQKLSRTKLIDRDTALNLGKLIAARSVITGNIIETRSGIEIVARLIDTEPSVILSTADVYDEVKDLVALKTLSQGMAVKIHQDFPLLDGVVIRQKGDHIFIDIGGDMVKMQRRFIVYDEEPIQHPVNGKILGTDNVIKGHARITQVMPELSKAKILDGMQIELMDKVIAE